MKSLPVSSINLKKKSCFHICRSHNTYLCGEHAADLAGDALHAAPQRVLHVVAADAVRVPLREQQSGQWRPRTAATTALPASEARTDPHGRLPPSFSSRFPSSPATTYDVPVESGTSRVRLPLFTSKMAASSRPLAPRASASADAAPDWKSKRRTTRSSGWRASSHRHPSPGSGVPLPTPSPPPPTPPSPKPPGGGGDAAGKPMRRGGGSGGRQGQKRRAHSEWQGGGGEAGRTGWVDGAGGIAARTSRRWRDRRGSGRAPAARNFQPFF
jgi:hypothetical protein